MSREVQEKPYAIPQLILPILSILFAIYLIYLTLSKRRTEFFIQSIIWLVLIDSILALVIWPYEFVSFDNSKHSFIINLIYSEKHTFFIENLICLVFVVKYDIAARSLPIVLKDIMIDYDFAEETNQSYRLSAMSVSRKSINNMAKLTLEIGERLNAEKEEIKKAE